VPLYSEEQIRAAFYEWASKAGMQGDTYWHYFRGELVSGPTPPIAFTIPT
jgi:hypothetical protein